MELVKKTIGECLTDRAIQTPNKIAIEYRDETYTWGELDRVSDCLAVRMLTFGVKKGDHVGIWSVNTPNWLITFFALQKVGAVPVLINVCYKEMELENIIRYADVRYMYYGDGYKSTLFQPLVDAISGKEWCRVEKWIPIGRDEKGGWMREDSFLLAEKSKKSMNLLARQKRQVKTEDVAAMLFTSGTTSVAKGVLLSHYNLLNSALGTLAFTKWTKEDKVLLAVPLFHCFGITTCLLTSVWDGATIHLLKYVKTDMVLDAIDRYRCTVLNGVPSMFLAMIRKPDFASHTLSSLRSGIVAGSPISPAEYREIQEKIPQITMLPSYGQTETSPCVTLMLKEDPYEKRAATAGRSIDHVEMRICDPVSGAVLEDGASGEIQVRGYNVMKGYYKMPEETQKTILADGWLRTGDLGFIDPEGYLHIVGRCKEMIIHSGENIAPQEIESVILELPYIEAVKVIGIPAEVVNEKVAACVVPKEGCTVNDAALLSYLKPRLAHYKLPSYVLKFTELPMNASGKVLLSELKEEAIRRVAEEEGRS